MAHSKQVPILMKVLLPCFTLRSPTRTAVLHRSIILILTFLSYMSYHMTRKSFSVVKTVLHRNCSEVKPIPDQDNSTTWCDWAPFESPDYDALLSSLDSAFLFSYAIAMFISGIVAERVNLRYFLSFGMIASGLFACLLGLAFTLNIHSLTYFIIVQILFGIAQTTGWPAVVAVCGHWFGKSKRGFIFGVWNSHTSIGNILGSLIAGYFVEDDWGYSFIVPGIIMACVGILIFLMLVVEPEHVNCAPVSDVLIPDVNNSGYSTVPLLDESYASSGGEEAEDDVQVEQPSVMSESSPILHGGHDNAIGFLGALKIPGVIEFSLSLFFAKLVSYTFLFWLPRYIKDSTTLSAELSADLSTLFDVGGIVGAIVAGIVSDASSMPASTCIAMLVASIPSLLLYQFYGSGDIALNIVLLMIAGGFVNGPYALITTAVSAELGTHESLQGNSKALATVTAIIDGTGSIGAAVGPLLAGLVSPTGWDNVFYLLIASDVLALLLLTRLTFSEFSKLRRRHHRSL